ncbi:cytochrome o ubiquinol oxidase subunit III [Ruegeria sp. HKCCD6228]|uniref:Cytochrome o ubiquinol oxidase subunit III n=1 Tax=Ruegeria atlantica TaxID=81569 RepID=A0ABX1WAS8_9RHOB|nr:MULTISPECIES: cytochrome c oxidase subunit 3 [Ruegeria]NOC92499.1 cytochrome o ubiquinol oxidase subunit III [Ruegeria sp. HKCCD6604]NOD30388.1 cytochrome o ubiquinol oxidase subunit III [Ruegeria atlantica]NOD97710.1 cytochrome o ubiquinol oxidase subunit III [Ruegeria sp. HKCCD6228]
MKRAPTHSYPGINLGERHASAHKATEVVTFGFWVFLMSDLVYFGLMFAIYITMIDAQAGGPGPHELFDLKSVFAQTLILLTSSLTVGLAMLALKYNLSRARIVLWFGVTLFLGISFLVLEVRDFMAMAEQGGIPQRSGFLSAFFGLVPLHGLHVAAGCLWLIVLGIQLRVKGMTDVIISRVVRLALFWHFLDLIWIGIITIVYFGGLTYG